jgi:hypothetical protein
MDWKNDDARWWLRRELYNGRRDREVNSTHDHRPEVVKMVS